jgi:hypothetical protein
MGFSFKGESNIEEENENDDLKLFIEISSFSNEIYLKENANVLGAPFFGFDPNY